jgi:hypothetical protein
MKKKSSLWQSVAGIFKDTSPFMRKVEKAALLAELNLCTLLCSLPVLTAGAAYTALHAALLQFPTLTYGSALGLYFRTFVRALKPTLPQWLLTLVAVTALGGSWYAALRSQLTDNFALMLPLLLSSAVVLFTAAWLYPLSAHLLTRNEPLRFREVLPSSLLLGLRELPRSFAVLILMLLSPALLLFASAQSITAVGIWLLFGIAPFALLHSFLVQNAINPQKSDSI